MTNDFWHSFEKPLLVLAPMVGVTESVFRILCKRYGADVVYSEMISADALVHDSLKTLAMLDHTDEELPLVVQLMGNKPEILAKAARIAEQRGASGIDINFGCPAHKIAKNFCGAMLMSQPKLCRDLILAVLNTVSIPVSIKVRTSITTKVTTTTAQNVRSTTTIFDLLDAIQGLPISAIMVHGRTFEDPFDGPIDLEAITSIKQRLPETIILANGGIRTVDDASAILSVTNADGLGLARSVLGKPWLFQQIRQHLDHGIPAEVDWQIIKERMIEHALLYEKQRGRRPFAEIRHHLTHYVRGIPGASHLREQLVKVDSPADVETILATV